MIHCCVGCAWGRAPNTGVNWSKNPVSYSARSVLADRFDDLGVVRYGLHICSLTNQKEIRYNKPMKKIVTIIVLALLVLGGYYLFGQSESGDVDDGGDQVDHTATTTDGVNDLDDIEWKTYSNEEYGISFEYPSTWVFTEGGSRGDSYEVIARVTNPAVPGIPNTDAPIEHFLVRKLKMTCDEVNSLTNGLHNAGWTTYGWQTVCFDIQNDWRIEFYAVIEVFDGESEKVFNKMFDSIVVSL